MWILFLSHPVGLANISLLSQFSFFLQIRNLPGLLFVLCPQNCLILEYHILHLSLFFNFVTSNLSVHIEISSMIIKRFELTLFIFIVLLINSKQLLHALCWNICYPSFRILRNIFVTLLKVVLLNLRWYECFLIVWILRVLALSNSLWTILNDSKSILRVVSVCCTASITQLGDHSVSWSILFSWKLVFLGIICWTCLIESCNCFV